MMKKFFLLITLAALSLAGYAQTMPNRMIVAMKNGAVTVYDLSQIDSLAFDVVEGPVAAAVEFKSFEWNGDDGTLTVTVTKSDAAASFRLAAVHEGNNVDDALAQAEIRTDDGDITLTIGGLEPGNTLVIATKAYDKYAIEGETSTITFIVPEKTASTPALAITIPTSFNTCWVQKVMYDGKKVAEVCKEYIKELTEQRIVVYPCDADGYAILTKGVSVNDGGTVVWDEEANTCTYTAGNSTTLSTVYLVDGEITIEAPESTEATTVEADLLVDKRGSEEISYKIVKIGTQYWLAENLRATKWIDGTAIDTYKSTQSAAWNANTTGCYKVYSDDNDYITIFGLLYNGYCVVNADRLAPEGWQVPSQDDWKLVRTYGGPAAANFKSDTDYSWNLGKEGSNINGFDAWAAGFYSSATGDADDGADAWFWTTTTYYDALTKSDTFQMIRLNQTTTNMVRYTTSGHAYTFGHSIRCVRKK